MAENKCRHESYRYDPVVNENGWKCNDCDRKLPGEPPGFRPDLDRSAVGEKIDAVLQYLDIGKLISISNSTHGEVLSNAVANRCRKNNRFDQYSIILFVMQEMAPDHADHWSKITDGILAGKDPRDRCWCGKLASQYGANGGVCSSKHDVDFRGRVKTVRKRSRAGQSPLFDAEDPESDGGEMALLSAGRGERKQ